MCAALSFVILYIGTLTGLLDMSGSILCGLITLIILRECSLKYAVCAAFVTFVLAFILISDKTVAVLYFTAGGTYPIIKPYLDKIRSKVLSWILKVICAVVIVSAYIAAVFLFVPAEASSLLIPAGLTLGIACIILYDVLLTRFEIIYNYRLRHLLRKR